MTTKPDNSIESIEEIFEGVKMLVIKAWKEEESVTTVVNKINTLWVVALKADRERVEERVTFDSVVPCWVSECPAWTLVAIKNGGVIWSTETPVKNTEIKSIYYRVTGTYAPDVVTEENTRVVAKHLYEALNNHDKV